MCKLRSDLPDGRGPTHGCGDGPVVFVVALTGSSDIDHRSWTRSTLQEARSLFERLEADPNHFRLKACVQASHVDCDAYRCDHENIDLAREFPSRP